MIAGYRAGIARLDAGLELLMGHWGLDQSNFSRLRTRLVTHDTARRFSDALVRAAREANLLSDEHFTVDGTLIEAWASLKSFKPKDGPPSSGESSGGMVDLRGQKRSNDAHESITDDDAQGQRGQVELRMACPHGESKRPVVEARHARSR